MHPSHRVFGAVMAFWGLAAPVSAAVQERTIPSLPPSAQAESPSLPAVAGVAEPSASVALGQPAAAPLAAAAGPAASTDVNAVEAAAPLNALFDRAAAYDPGFWSGLEASLLAAVGSTSAPRPGAWVRGAAVLGERWPGMTAQARLAESLKHVHRLDRWQAEIIDSVATFREQPSVPAGGSQRFFQVDGKLYVTSDAEGLLRLDGSRWVDASLSDMHVLHKFRGVTAMASIGGRLMVADHHGLHAVRRTAGSVTRWIDYTVTAPINAIARIDGTLYVATEDGLRFFRGEREFEDRHWVRGTWERAGLSGRRVVGLRKEDGRWLAETADGALYAAAPRGGLARRGLRLLTGRPAAPQSWSLLGERSGDPPPQGPSATARLVPTGGALYAADGNRLYKRQDGAWTTVVALIGEIRDAIEFQGVLWLATDRGPLPMVEAWHRAWAEMESKLARVTFPAVRPAAFSSAEQDGPAVDAWNAVASLMLEAVGLQGRSAAAALRRAAVETLRNSPGLELTDILASALDRVHALDARRQRLARGALGLDAFVDGEVHLVFRHGDDLFASTDEGLIRIGAAGREELKNHVFSRLSQAESIDGKLYTLSRRDLMRFDGSAWRSLAFGSETFAVVDGSIFAGTEDSLSLVGSGMAQTISLHPAPGALHRLRAHDDALFAATSLGFFVRDTDWRPLVGSFVRDPDWRPIADRIDVKDAWFEDGRWWLATEGGLYSVVDGQAPRWVPESAAMRFERLRPSPRGMIALGPDGALRRRGRRWVGAPELRGARDVLEDQHGAYVATGSGLFARFGLPEGWAQGLLADLARDAQAALAAPADAASTGPLLKDARGRSLLDP